MQIGHTSLTWGVPGDIEQAYREVAELGYAGFETFGAPILEWNQKPGGYKALADRYGIPTVAAYCQGQWIDPATAQEDQDVARRIADALKEVGGQILVLQAGRRLPDGYTAEHWARLAQALDAVGSYCESIGLACGVHPHTKTALETRTDVDALLQRLDSSVVGLVPDTGQIAKAGSDVLDLMRTYASRIPHVHLKDWSGRYEHDDHGKEIDATGYRNYVPVGQGVLPIPALLELLFDNRFDGWVMVDTDRTEQAPHPPYEAAAISRHYLGEALGERVKWK